MALSCSPTSLYCQRRNFPFTAAKTTSFSDISVQRSNLRCLKQPPLSSIFIKNPTKPYLPKKSTSSTIRSLFTGIVEEMGTVKQIDQGKNSFTIKIEARTILEDIHLGDSICVNGTCLTVTEFDTDLSEFSVGLSPETLRKTNLGELESGCLVNLERAVNPSTRMGGHFVQGHVDGTGEIVDMASEGDSLWVKVKVETRELLRCIVPKGFIAVDGTSLTVVDVFDEESCFNLMLVVYMQQKITIPLKKIGQRVNLEVDILGKYVGRFLSTGFPAADSIHY